MEPGDRPAPSFGLRLLAGCGLLTALAFLQSPGRTVTDTKLDLVVDPGRFLTRALSMWDPVGYLGQIQNQAYGYLFPMGPFFWLGQAITLPPWVIQRLWWSLLLCLAFTGFVWLARALGIGGMHSALIGGFAYALSPRILSVMGSSSVEVWPMAVAPWVLLPLVVGMKQGSARRAAALSAVAVACVGGVNAVATLAVIPLAGLWLLMNTGPRRATMLRWWPPLVLLGTIWWLGPLLLLGRYSPPFLDFIESASVTTRLASIDGALRGVTNWVPVVSPSSRAGVHFFTDTVVIADAAMIVAAGLVGLTLRGLPHRRFLVVGLFLGTTLVTFGHTGPVHGWGAEHLQDLLDGVLAPMRNTHKFDVILRIPLTLGFVHALSLAARALVTRPQRWGLGLALASVFVGSTLPAWSDQLAPTGTFDGIPQYWQDTTGWVSDHAEPGRGAILLPSSAFPDYLWGSTGDEPIQPLSTGSWILRNSVPLTPAGTIRLLDAISDEVSTGRADPALADNLARSGIGYVVVRNDLQVSVSEDRNAVVRASLQRSPGIELVASFGPRVGGSGFAVIDGQRSYSRGGWSSSAPAVEIFQVTRATTPHVRPTTVAGSAADLLGLRSMGAVTGDAVLASDQGSRPVDRYVLTDGLREQEVAFGAVDRVRSATKLPGESWTMDRPVHDYLSPGQQEWLTRARLSGAVTLRASSARSDAASLQLRRTDSSPWAAFDESRETAWRPDGGSGWIELGLDRARTVAAITLRGGLPAGQTQDVVISAGGERREISLVGDEPATFPLGLVDTIRIEVARTRGDAQLSSVQLAGVPLKRTLELPSAPTAWGDPQDVVLGLGSVRRPGCIEFDDSLRCRGGQEDLSEDAGGILREFTTVAGHDWKITATMGAVASRALDDLAQRGRDVTIETSSTVTDDPGASGVQMLDGSRGTAWIADPEDTDPTIRVRWDEPVTFRSLRLTTPVGLPASSVARVIVRSGDRRISADVQNGRVRLDAPVTSDDVSISLVSAKDARDYRTDGTWTTLPVGVGELTVGTSVPRLDTEQEVAITCDQRSGLRVGAESIPVAGSATLKNLLSGGSITLTACQDVSTIAGPQQVESAPLGAFVPETVRLQRTDAPAPSGPAGLEVFRWNSNPAWTDAGGADAAVVNGWQQGFWTTGQATPDFTAEPTYTRALRVGALAVALLLIVTAVVRRRRRLTPSRTWAPRPLVGGLLVVAVLTFGGLAGGAAAVLGAALASVPRRAAAPAVVAIAMAGSVAVTVFDDKVVSSGGAQVFAAVALGAVARAALTRR